MGQLSDWIIIVCNGLLSSHKWSGIFIKGRICSNININLLRSSPAYGRSTSCTAWQPDRWPGLLGSSMAMGWSHPGARGSGGSSGNHGDSAGSSSRFHPDGYPARFQHLSAEDTGAGRVTITHMTNASPPEGKGMRRGRGQGMAWIDESALLVGQQNICKNQTRVKKKSELMPVKM